MLKGFFNVPEPVNEPVLNYGPRSLERAALKAALEEGPLKANRYTYVYWRQGSAYRQTDGIAPTA
jgi:hypothetical protein